MRARPGGGARRKAQAVPVTAALSALLLLSGAPGRAAEPLAAPVLPFAEGVETLLLVGDAGAPAVDEPLLRALSAEAARDPARTLVVFLGDNLYPSGLPAEGDPWRKEGERRLAAQAGAALRAGARVLFVPGNHDWAGMGKDGLSALLRQERFLAALSPRLLYAPGGGCPGPLLLPTPSGVTLAVLDTQWWLQHEGPKPEGDRSPCAAKSGAEAAALLRDAAGRGPIALLTHHPLASGGPHGGRARDWRAHLFPLRDASPTLWVPLPGLGSLWALYRDARGTGQDLASRRYAKLRADLASALEGRPALFQASGHDHSLQVLEAPVPEARWVLVSGSGIYPRGNVVSRIRSTRFGTTKAGFLRVRLDRGAPPRLTVLLATPEGTAEERFSADLR